MLQNQFFLFLLLIESAKRKKYWSDKYTRIVLKVRNNVFELYEFTCSWSWMIHTQKLMSSDIIQTAVNIIQTALFSYSIDKMYYVLILQTANKKVNNGLSK